MDIGLERLKTLKRAPAVVHVLAKLLFVTPAPPGDDAAPTPAIGGDFVCRFRKRLAKADRQHWLGSAPGMLETTHDGTALHSRPGRPG